MRCSSNSVACESGCGTSLDGDDDKPRPISGQTEGFSCSSPRRGDSDGICIKCKIDETIAATHPSVGKRGGDTARFCCGCFRSNLYGKFRFAVTSNAMISPSDNVLVAFSGGISSRVALQFVHEMQQKAQQNFEASRDRSLAVFRVGVAFIDESTIYPVPPVEFQSAIDGMQDIVSSLTPPAKGFLVVPLESLYSPDSSAGRDQLSKLASSVSDVTGKEDLLDHFRLLSLQKAAVENGYTKIVMGTCTSRIACHVLEETVKGKGFSLAADIQYVDARWKIPVVLPLRDCLLEELRMLCDVDSLKTIEAFQRPRMGINGLISSFVKLVKEENPSRESTIVRTAGKLTPFAFNRLPESDDKDSLASKRRQKKYNLKTEDSLDAVSHCIICSSPLKVDATANSCVSCQHQMLPKDPSQLESFVALLPQAMTNYRCDSQELLREQIHDFLLSDDDG